MKRLYPLAILGFCLLAVLALGGMSVSAQAPVPTNLKEFLALPPMAGEQNRQRFIAWAQMTAEIKSKVEREFLQTLIDSGRLNSLQEETLREVIPYMTPAFYADSKTAAWEANEAGRSPESTLLELGQLHEKVRDKLDAAFVTREDRVLVGSLFIWPRLPILK